MKTKKSRLKSLFAMLLVVSMVCQQSSLTVLATEDTYGEETTVEPTPSESEPEEYAEESEEAEVEEEPEEPEQPAQEEEPQQPEDTENPAETPDSQEPADGGETPATPAPEQPAETTGTPAAEVTEAPAENQPTEAPAEATPTPEVSVAPSETPTPEVTEAPVESTEFNNVSVDNAIANVSLSTPIDEKAVFVAKQKSEDSEYFNNAMMAVMQWADHNGLALTEGVVYDMHFENEDGSELSYGGSATVNLQFMNPILNELQYDDLESVKTYVLHVVNGNVQDVNAGVSQNANGAVDGVTIQTDGFSPFVIVKGGTIVALSETPKYELTDYVEGANGITVSINKGGSQFNPGDEYEIDQTFSAKLEFELSNDKISSIKNNLPSGQDVIFKYKLPQEIIGTSNNVLSDQLVSKAGEKCGTYTILPDGTIEFKINNAFFISKSTISGKFEYFFQLNKEKVTTNDKVEITFPGTPGKTEIKVKKPTVNVNKTHTMDSDGNFTFTIPVTGGKRDSTNVVVTDTPGSNLEIDYDSIRIDGNPLGQGKLTKKENGSFEILLDKVDANKIVNITYSAKIKNKELVENDIIKDINNAYSWTVNGENGGSNTEWINYVTKYKPGSKSVSNDGNNNQRLNWTVSLNTGNLKNDISGYKYVDKMSSDSSELNQKYDKDSLIVKSKDGKDITNECAISWGEDGKNFTVKFQSNLGEDGKKEYQITYSTEPKTPLPVGGTVEVKNDGTFDGNPVIGTTGTSKNPKQDTEKLEKSGQFDENTSKIKWTVTYTPPADGITNPVFEDRISQGSFKDGWDNGYQDIIYDEDSFVISSDGKGLDTNDYALSFSKSEKAQNEKAPGNDCATITFSGTYNKPITITYTASYVGKKGIQKSIYNHCKVNQKEASAEVKITIKNSIAKKGEYSYSQTNHTGYIEWTIYANIANHQANDVDSGAIDYGGKTVTIKEYLPKGLEFVSAVCKKWDGWGNGSNGNNGYGKTSEDQIIPTESNGVLIFSIPDVHKDVIRIKITTKVAKLDPDANGNTVYYNKASWSVDGSGDLGDADTSVTVKETLLTKKGDVYKASETDLSKTTLEYTIEVNPHALLLNSGNNLELSDELPDNVNFVAGSVTITDANNKAILGASSALVNGKLLIEVPDATYAIVKYRVTPNLNGITPDDKGNYSFKAKNTVQLIGYGFVKATDENSYTVRKAQGSLEGAKNSLTLVKYDAEDTNKKLENAKFKLVLLDLNGSEVSEVPTTEQNTNSNGVIIFDNLGYDCVYYYQEVEAPEGYVLDNTKHYFCIKSQESSYNAVAKKFKQLLPDATLEVSAGGETKDVTNIKKSTAQIVVNKESTGATLKTYEKRDQFKFKLVEVDEQ
ncbi:MAG: SpaA isopeptide-forming pilin-related protein, partial [Clostridia bacterium]|nr:SpaA isopeptide-forming pilin-related protein [Clostridia bacterium]